VMAKIAVTPLAARAQTVPCRSRRLAEMQ